jgi:hypothetical protein
VAAGRGWLGDRQQQPAKKKTWIMNKAIDTRSLFTGFVMGALALLCLGAALKHGNQPGRFQLGVGDGQAYVIDTVSGQVWQRGGTSQQEFFAPKAQEKNF